MKAMSDKNVTITKVGAETPAPKPATAGKAKKPVATRKSIPDKKPKFGILKRGKTARSKPRFEAVRDPTTAPPLRIMTHKGEKTRRNKITDDAKKLPIHKIRETLKRNNLPVSGGKEGLIREIYANAKEAGMLSV